ncbi:MAG: amidohydrolase family protein [Gammaproteobacteria bacterium]|nr:amidohydrolase family protein [Gammaproteobacteria bacterium]
MRINGHGHLLPKPEQIPQFMRDKKFFWVDDKREFMCQGDWKRPITAPSFFLEEKLEWMSDNNIDHEVVLSLSQLYCNGIDETNTLDIIRFQNDFNASVQAEHPDKFTTGFVVQPAHLTQALSEIERCVKELDMKMLCLSTHYQSNSGEWLSVADETCEPIWELVNDLELAVEIHPYDAGKIVNLKDKFWRNHLVWMMAQTADTYLMFTLNGLSQRFPAVRTCFAHGNMLGHANYGRVVQGLEGRPDLFPEAHHPADTLGQENVYFDSLVHDPYTLQLLLHRCGDEQIVWGVDDPYPLGEMETVRDCYPGIFIDQAEQKGIISASSKQKLMGENAARWLRLSL